MKAWGGRASMIVLMAMALSLGLFIGLAPAQKFADFVNQKFKFATQLPSHWESAVKDNSLVFSGPQGTEEYNVTINFQFINRKSQDSLEAQGQDLERQLATAQGYKLLVQEKGRISGQPALRLAMVYQTSSGLYQQEQFLVERGPYFYYIGYTAPQRLFKKYKWALDQVIKTFKFLPDGK